MKRPARAWARPALVIGAVLVVAAGATAAVALEDVPAPAAARTAPKAGPAATFAEPVIYATGVRPWNNHVTDLNGDGVDDVITVNGNNTQKGTVSVLLSKSDGTYADKIDTTIDFLTFGVTAGDLTGDGVADLAVSGGEARGFVKVLRGGAAGVFTADEGVVNVGYSPNAIVLADVNRDRKLDIITANYFASTVSVVLGNGNGTFKPEKHFMVGPTPQGLTVTDVNGDRKLDIVTGGFGLPEMSATVALGRGDGSFQPSKSHPAGEAINDAGVADFNGDGIKDLVTAGFVGRDVTVLLGKGRHGTDYQAKKSYPTAFGPNGLVVVDLNKDGITDVLTSASPVQSRVPTNEAPATAATEPEPEKGGVAVLYGNGDGTLAKYVLHPIQAGAVTTIATVDVNGDGWLDLVGTVMDKNQVAVWLNTTGI